VGANAVATKRTLSAFERDALTAVDDGARLDIRERGLVCALLAEYRRQCARSTHLGTVGQTVTVLLERTVTQASHRHPGLRRHDFLDTHANRLVWWQVHGPALSQAPALILRWSRAPPHPFAGRPVTVLARCWVTPASCGAT
jgi:hypothetical protein